MGKAKAKTAIPASASSIIPVSASTNIPAMPKTVSTAIDQFAEAVNQNIGKHDEDEVGHAVQKILKEFADTAQVWVWG